MHVAHTSLRVDLTYRIARRLIAARQARQGANNAEAVDWQTYNDWRYRSLKRQFNENFSIAAIIGMSWTLVAEMGEEILGRKGIRRKREPLP